MWPSDGRQMFSDENVAGEEVKEEVFEVSLTRNGLGLGISVGLDGVKKTFFRVKKVFPLQPAWQSGRLRVGDILLEADGVPLAGLRLRRALDVLRTGPKVTTLRVLRRHVATAVTHDDNNEVSDTSDYNAVEQEPLEPGKPSFFGEFSVELKKVNGGLGFTLSRGGDDERSALRHAIKALVREPAQSDGRIQPGDKLIRANGVDCQAFSHQELVAFLRACPEVVVLSLYRDASRSQTPVSPETFSRPSAFLRDLEKTTSLPLRNNSKQLRYEAKEMVRSLQASRTSLDNCSPGGSCASGSSGGYGGSRLRQRRGLSPHGGGGLSRFTVPVYEDDISAPLIETPISPMNDDITSRSLPPLMLGSVSPSRTLQIEELLVTPTSSDLNKTLSDSAVDVSVQEPETPLKLQRPCQLNLFAGGGANDDAST